ncbi:MAG: hypothetical protein LBP92_06355 [Deltaproteobacteria bacterium]|jgi:transcriptional regulator with XRE-family HTH domain|nr:hypothetical protein [Deltaproteobacteria bacterium]
MKQLLVTGAVGPGNGETPRDQPAAQAISVTSLEVRRVRKSLSLTVEHFALLIGVSPSSIFRYENVGVNAFHQGPVSRKLCLLSSWIEAEGKVAQLRGLLAGKGGLAILAGLLEAGSVKTCHLPFEAYAAGPDAGEGSGLPSLESLAEGMARAFGQTVVPAATPAPGGQGAAMGPEDMAGQIEAEARVMEAEARKLEAQARKLEAEARIRSAQALPASG